MTSRTIRQAYDAIAPDAEARERMLQNILSSEIPPAGKDETMKKRKIWRALLIAAIIVTLACTAVTAAELIRVPVQDTSAYQSQDSTVEITMSIDEEVSGEYMPMLEVKPHQITPEEAKRVAYAIFGEKADFYEKVDNLAEFYTKAEIEQKLERWSQYTTLEALEELYGDWMTDNDVLELVDLFIERYQEKLTTAPEEIPYTPCEWTFKKACEYYHDYDGTNYDPEESNDQIYAQLYVGDIPYSFCASNRDKEDFKVNNIYAVVSTGISPNGIDEEIFKARLFRTAEPTQAQLDAVKTKAEAMLAAMDMGSWMIDQCYVDARQISQDVTEYSIMVTAVPVLNGVPAVRVPQFTALRGQDPAEKNYYYADVQFEFSPNGDLWNFHMYSPIEIVDDLNSGETMTAQQLLEKAKEYLLASSYTDYSFIPSIYTNEEDVLRCRVNVTSLDYNLTRINKPGYYDRFYYIPGITLSGTVEYYEEKSGNVLYSEELTLLNLDGRNGSIISGIIKTE